MKLIDIALAIGLVCTIFFTSFTTFARDCSEVREDVLRLHILANSDSEADQNLKIAIRDRILDANLLKTASDKALAEQLAKSELVQIELIARDEIERQGYGYPVKAELVNMYFSTRTYETATLPAGYYDAVRVSIGEAKGKNWWCVLFPPMCVPAAGEKIDLQTQIEHLGEQPHYVPKLAVLELIEAAKDKISDDG